ncbi:sigma-70 family RNA polymerase sigma factor [Clostridium cellulovorans]|uniref:RNA polymerase sigma factor n=1 Tax=Clostridium cellulovorans (strain ATCC 35296 / DSM 3052 / OCM 3 / 743B) TaxID=573061 RepID=D9SVQ6_CLOC7|nr:RNA polymerase sigma factor RpoD/SigA [Clostridium cellulovorans]ADL53117.1 RNA polymerase, sigma 32 subunit, RpoH [Clostridium cellulovorans 743B]
MLQLKINYKELTNEELVTLYQTNKDITARDYLIINNKRLVYKAASLKKDTSLLAYDDLVQEGLIGLMIGIEKFNADYNSKFSTYIYYWIKQRIDRAIYNTGTSIRLPIHLINKINKVMYVENKNNVKSLDNDSTDLCTDLDITDKQYDYYKFLVKQFKNIISLNSALLSDNSEGDEELIDFIDENSSNFGDPGSKNYSIDSNIIKEELSHDLNEVLKTLNEREQHVLRMRFGLDDGEMKTLEQIGNHFNVTRERIRQIESKALKKLRNPKILMRLEGYYYN